MPTKDSLKVITGAATDDIKVKDARWFAILSSVATAAVSSFVTRKRAAAGEEPILKVFF